MLSNDARARKKAIIVACGSFNPPTNGHLRMMVLAREKLESLPSPFAVVEGIFSPVSSAYLKKDLESDQHRLNMLLKATESSGWMLVYDWEQRRGEWMKSVEVLRYHRAAARARWNDESLECFFLCGDDLVESFTRILPDGSRLWALADVREIVEDFGIIVNTRNRFGRIPIDILCGLGLSLHKCYIVADEVCPHAMSSTLMRQAIAERRSIRYCTPDTVIEYISEHGLYKDQPVNS